MGCVGNIIVKCGVLGDFGEKVSHLGESVAHLDKGFGHLDEGVFHPC